MIHDSELFDFQSIIATLREKMRYVDDKDLGKDDRCYKSLLGTIHFDAEFEDLSLYKDYLSQFDVEHELGGLNFAIPPVLEKNRDDIPYLVLLTAASYATQFDLEFDSENNAVDFLLHVTTKEKDVVTQKSFKLKDLTKLKIQRCFEIYLAEQLNMEAIRQNSDSGKRFVEERRSLRLIIFKKKLNMLKRQHESAETISSLDELLNE